MRQRAESEDIEQQCLVVALPAVWQKPAFWLPGLSEGDAAILRPLPINPLIQGLGQPSDFALFRNGAVEIGGARQRTSEQNRRVDRGKLTIPGATARANVEKVIVKTAITRGSRWVKPLLALMEESQRREHALDRRMT